MHLPLDTVGSLQPKMVTKRKDVNEDIEMSSGREKVKEKKMGWSKGSKKNKTTKNVNVESSSSSGTTWSTESEVVSRPRRLPRQRSSAPPEDLEVLEEAEEFDEDEDDDEEDDIPVQYLPLVRQPAILSNENGSCKPGRYMASVETVRELAMAI